MELRVFFESVRIADWVMNLALQATVILLVSQIVRRLCVKCSAPTRSDLCFITMLLLLVLPFGSLVSAYISSMTIQLRPLTEGRWNPDKTSQTTGKTSLGPVETTSVSTSAAPPEPQLPDIGNATVQPTPDVSGKFSAILASLLKIRLILPAIRLIHVINLFGGIWFIGTMILLIRLAHGLTYARTIGPELIRLESPRLRATLHAVMDVFGTKTPTILYSSMLTNTPHTIGVVTPSIVLPVELCQTASDDELKSILLHEMAHIAHKDQWAGVLQRLMTALWWWNPLVYSLSADFSEQREYICDNYAIRHGNPRVFATCLFKLAKRAREFRVLPTALCAATSKPALEHRIKAILFGRGRSLKTTSTKTAFLLGLIAALVLAGGLVRINWTMAAQETAQETLVRAATFPFLSDPIQIAFDDASLYLVEKTAIYVLNRQDYALRGIIRPQNLSIQRIDVQSEHIIVTGAHAVMAFDKQSGKLMRTHRDHDNTLMQVQPLGEQWVGFYDEGSSGKPAVALCDAAGDKCDKLLDIEPHCDWKVGTCNDFKTPWGFGASLDRLVVAPDAEFKMVIFDEHGHQLAKIFRDNHERIPITEAFKEQYANLKKSKYPGDSTKLEFSDNFPALAAIKVSDGKIYAATYKQHDGKWECFIYNLNGTYIGTRYVPVKQPWPGIELGTIGITDGSVYELAEEGQQWHLYVSDLDKG